ncbi:response regulator transcription factor [Phragmitibacter flavus]|uniref:Response regulator transcription factor n=1 Tax=Phragmitibacter flavus TaxID=2576071 RepID=A0A5R8K7A3_9BACT|nr:response regulator transcription factor [Phragmitibacter flavus]TLD68244.1 response regulator transcription factor [Phragmitibacter flavus]
MISIMLVDDHFVVRNGLATSLEIEPDLKVIATSDTGENAATLYQQHRPTVVLMDMQLPGINGAEATALIRDLDPDARILIFSTFARDEEIVAALDSGASGYLQKTATREELITALRLVASGNRYLPSDLAQRLTHLQTGPTITPREREIIALVAQGSANKEIGAQLGISEDTVKQHVSRILQKLGVKDRAQATAEAIRRGIVKLD